MPCASHLIQSTTSRLAHRKLHSRVAGSGSGSTRGPASVGARAVLLVLLEVGGEHPPGGPDEADGGVGQVARAPPLDVAEPAVEVGERARRRLPGGERFERAGDRVETVHARAALPGALRREVRARRGPSPRPRRHSLGSAATTPQPSVAPARRRTPWASDELRGVGRVRASCRSSRPRGPRPSSRAIRRRRRARCSKRRATLELVDAGPVDRAEHGGEDRARFVRGADRAEPRRAVARDQREVREGLHVLHERGSSAHTAFVGPGRHRHRPRLVAVQEVDERALLAGDVATGHLDDVATRRDRAISPPRSAIARTKASRAGMSARSTTKWIVSAPTARAATTAPSITRWGARRISTESL